MDGDNDVMMLSAKTAPFLPSTRVLTGVDKRAPRSLGIVRRCAWVPTKTEHVSRETTIPPRPINSTFSISIKNITKSILDLSSDTLV